jgi:hypothetical protein
LGGNSWEKIGQVWYHGLWPDAEHDDEGICGPDRQAAHTLYSTTPAVFAAVDAGWKRVGL